MATAPGSSIGLGPGWQRLKQRALAAAQPLSAYLELTYACSWRCSFCYNPRRVDQRRLDLAEWSEVLDDLRQLGTLSVTLTGGEPLAHPQFLAIAAAARARRFAVRIFTNGSLVGEEMADAIAGLRPRGVELSLRGASAATHDRATRVPGSFAAMWLGVERLRRRGVPLVLKTLLRRGNEHELDLMIGLVERSGIAHRVDATITPVDDGDPSPLGERASAEAITRMYLRTRERGTLPFAERVEGGLNCGIGRITLAVDPEGEVFPCIQWRRTSLGNVRQDRLRALWQGSPQREQAARLALTANTAMRQRGAPVATLPFCPALAAQLTGDPHTPDEGFAEQARIVERVRAQGR